MPEGDEVYHPAPKKFADLVINVLNKNKVHKKDYNLQSFDFRVLKTIHQNYPDIPLAALVYQSDLVTTLNKLGFKPDIHSPYYPLVNRELIRNAHQKNIKVIPWTVNTKTEMLNLLNLGVDGIITDYPGTAMKIKK